MINRADDLTPKPIERDKGPPVNDTGIPFGSAYHGVLDHKSAERLLEDSDPGCFLIRRSGSSTAHFTLSCRFQGGRTKHFKLYYDTESGLFFLKQQYKHFATIEDLVEDGLLNYHLEEIHGRERTSTSAASMAASNQNLLLPKSISREEVPQEAANTKRHHIFKVHTFRGLNWCEVCAQFLWGFSVQGMRCENCSFVAHKRCASSSATQLECLMDKNDEVKGPLFGVELGAITKLQSNSIPFIVVKCVEEIEARGIFQEGIYRVSGFADEVEELKNTFERLGRQTNVAAENLNIHTVAGVLKLYFRSLPTPLITAECSALLMTSLSEDTEDDGQQLKTMKTNLLRLPMPHWNCLKYMANHLRRVGTYHEQNKMNESNLATVFAPTLIGTDLHQFTDLSREIILLAYIIRHCTILFS